MNDQQTQAEVPPINEAEDHATWEDCTPERPRASGHLILPAGQISRPRNSLSIQARRFDPFQRPPELRPVYSLNGVVIATPGNIQAIAAQAKAGKSGFVNAMIAAPMAVPGSDTLCLTSSNPSGLALVHIDTEQSPYDHWAQAYRALRRAGRAEHEMPTWFFSYSFAGITPREARKALWEMVEQADEKCGGVHTILIDGAADLVDNVNDLEECVDLVAELHSRAIDYDCDIPCVIHFNPSSANSRGYEKGRGHLGSQIERKAETNLRIDKKGEVSQVWSEKQRHAPIPNGQGPRYVWSVEADMHVSAEVEALQVADAQRQTEVERRDRIFQGNAGMRRCDLERKIKDGKVGPKCSQKTAQRTVTRWARMGLIQQDGSELWMPTT